MPTLSLRLALAACLSLGPLSLVPGLGACGGRVVFDGVAQGGAGGGSSEGGGGEAPLCGPDGFSTLAADVDTTPTGIAAGEVGVSWTSEGEVWIAGPSGEFPSTVETDVPEPWALAQAGDELYVAGYASQLRRIVRSSGALVWEVPDAAYDLALDAQWVYFVNNIGVFRVPREGGVVTLLEPVSGSSLAVDDETIVVLERDAAGVTVRALDQVGGSSAPLASVASSADCSSCGAASGFLDRVAIVGEHAFFAVDTRLFRVPLVSGGELELVLDAAPLDVRAVVSAGGVAYVGLAEPFAEGAVARVDPSSLEVTELVRGEGVAPWSLAPASPGVYWSTYQPSGVIGRTCGL
jgi:hypothetical protein